MLCSIHLHYYLDALADIKTHYFVGNDIDGYEPCCGTVSIANGTARSIGHLIAASICNGGPGPGFFASWVYSYITSGIEEVFQKLPTELSSKCKYHETYSQVHVHSLRQMSKQ